MYTCRVMEVYFPAYTACVTAAHTATATGSRRREPPSPFAGRLHSSRTSLVGRLQSRRPGEGFVGSVVGGLLLGGESSRGSRSPPSCLNAIYDNLLIK